MKYVKLDPEAFQAKLNTVVRFWNDLEQRGQAHNQASAELKNSCKYIFLRDDGWSIASPELEGARNLWPDEWAYCYVLEGSSHRVSQADFTEKPKPRSRWTGSKAEFQKMIDRQGDASGMMYSDADPGL